MQVMRRLLIASFLAALGLLPAGCAGGSRSRVEAPDISPSGAAAAALAEYDSNKDGYLDAKELEQCPALKGALKTIDKDGDGRLSADEIADRLTGILGSRVGLLALACQVTLNGRPLKDATVTFVPEKFLGSAVRTASGVTDRDGVASPAAGGAPGIQPGYYRVSISKKDAQGKETLPARYNTQTTLGQEVAPSARNDPVVFALKGG
jgi:hypothetical protein